MNKTTRHKINKDIQEFISTINQQDLTSIYRTLYPKTMKYTLFASANGT